jgi:inorganic pyrophosphatase
MHLQNLSIGKKAPAEVNVVIEIAQGSPIKYEMDKDSGFLTVDRFLYTAMVYPFNYGFIPHTLAEDGDPMDILVLSTHPVLPGSVMAARPIGVLEMEDEAGIDVKILAVPTAKIDPWFADIQDIDDIAEPVRNQIQHFFNHYKELEPGKWVKLKSILPKKDALAMIEKSIQK